MTPVKAARHTGLVVKDLERSLAFYRDALGLEVVSKAEERGAYIETLVGIPGAVVEWVKLMAPGGHLLELLRYPRSAQVAAPEELGRADRPGCSHAAFTVLDADALYDVLTGLGYKCNSRPLTSPDGKVKVMYAHDPDGIIVELVEELDAGKKR